MGTVTKESKERRVPRWVSNVLLLSIGTAVAWVAGEFVLVLLGMPTLEPRVSWRTEGLFHRLDPDLIYSLRPGARIEWKNDEFVEIASVNRDGLRGAELRSGVPRLLVLGDSMTFGHGVEDHQTYPAVLAGRLASRGHDIEVVNGAVKGYGIDQSYQRFVLHLRSLAPDGVLLAVNHNDVDDDADRPLFTLDGDELRPRDATRDRLYRATALKRAVPEALHASRVIALAARFAIAHTSAPPLVFEDEAAKRDFARRKARILIGKLAEIAREDGFDFAIVTIPAPDRDEAEYRWLDPPPDGVPILDLHGEGAWRARADEFFYPTDPHFTAVANEWMAEAIGSFLLDASLPWIASHPHSGLPARGEAR